MALLFWDASALAKRYFGELGSSTVNALFAAVPPQEMASTAWGYAETYSMLLRKLNGGVVDLPTFTTAVTALQAELVASSDFGLLPISDLTVFASIAVMRNHNLNATDAAVLRTLLEYVAALPPGSPRCALVASDQRLIRAAQSEGLATLNPELLPVAGVPAALAAL
jgi:predicted nucleic acid-binding protein